MLSSPVFLAQSNKAVVNIKYSKEGELGFYIYVEGKHLPLGLKFWKFFKAFCGDGYLVCI